MEKETNSRKAEKLFSRPEGATMNEVLRATGDYQYNVLRRLEAKGYLVRKKREGRATRYWVTPPVTRAFDLKVAPNGQTTLPKPLRVRLGVATGGQLEAVVDGDHIALRPRTRSLDELFGILRRPGARPKTADEIEAGIAAGAIESALGEKVGQR